VVYNLYYIILNNLFYFFKYYNNMSIDAFFILNFIQLTDEARETESDNLLTY